jgi:hypothetical protein
MVYMKDTAAIGVLILFSTMIAAWAEILGSLQ